MSLAKYDKPTVRGDWTGVQVGWIYGQPVDTIKRTLDHIKSLGFRFIRVPGLGDWTICEPTSGKYNFGVFDNLMSAAQERELYPIATCSYTPAWIRPQHPIAPATTVQGDTPPDPGRLNEATTHFGNMIGALGKHFPWLRVIEGWTNEGNCSWGSNPCRGDIAFQLNVAAAAAFTAAKGTNRFEILSTSMGTANPQDVTQAKMGAKLSYDWLAADMALAKQKGTPLPWKHAAHHPYTTWGDAFAKTNDVWYNALVYQTAVMIWNNAVAQLPKPYVWATEAGWPSSGPDSTYMKQVGGGNAEIGSAKTAEKHLDYWATLQDTNFVGPFVVYNWDDLDVPGYGMLRNDGSEKPICATLKRLNAQPWTGPK